MQIFGYGEDITDDEQSQKNTFDVDKQTNKQTNGKINDNRSRNRMQLFKLVNKTFFFCD